MNKITKQIIASGITLLLIFTVFSLLRIHNLQGRRTSELNTLQTRTNLQEPMTRDGRVMLRLANNQGPEHPASRACDYFAELVEQRTEGRIKILNYHSGQLGDEKSTVSQVMYGGIDLARVSIALLTDYEPELIALQMPYLYESADHMWNVLDSKIGDEYLEKMREIGVEGLCWYDAGARNFYTTDRAVCGVKDLRGLKIRVQESAFMSDMIRALGAEPVEISYNKVGSALKNGEVDGAENNFSSYISTGHYACAKHIVTDEHVRIPEVIIMNKAVMEQLPREDQEIIYQAAQESSVRQRELWKEQDAENTKILQEA
ncbi:MAG: TRAP transporter substrate-binding protein, partial [Lachnospiraceae bacterium]|nr:TRAP transporter substrate-binding protein [Lachnospiraceae bacterium]